MDQNSFDLILLCGLSRALPFPDVGRSPLHQSGTALSKFSLIGKLQESINLPEIIPYLQCLNLLLLQ